MNFKRRAALLLSLVMTTAALAGCGGTSTSQTGDQSGAANDSQGAAAASGEVLTVIGGSYVAFNRPVPSAIGNPEMWIAKSPDLIHWGEQKHFCGLNIEDEDAWDNGRIGGGAVPFLTERGWVKIYHAANKEDRYCLGAFLLDKDDPSKVLAKTRQPILTPEADYEVDGFFGNVVFTCGCLVKDRVVSIYYGAADDKICRADCTIDDIFEAME